MYNETELSVPAQQEPSDDVGTAQGQMSLHVCEAEGLTQGAVSARAVPGSSSASTQHPLEERSGFGKCDVLCGVGEQWW